MSVRLLRLFGGCFHNHNLPTIIIAAVAANAVGKLGLLAPGAFGDRGFLKLPVGQSRTGTGLGMPTLW